MHAAPHELTTPSNTQVPIVPRRPKFSFKNIGERFFFDNNSLLSTMTVALSATFPPGEKEFIQSVRLFTDRVTDPQLLADVKLFTAQEAQHSLQHKRINEAFEALGYSADKVTRFLEDEIETWEISRSPAERLGTTVVLEHVTAIMAHFTLSNPERFDSIAPEVRELMAWHAVEEIEHKSVAFDVYMNTVGDRNLLRWLLLKTLVLFPLSIGGFQRFLLQEIGHRPSAREIADAARFLFGSKGLISSVLPQYLALLKPNFHPWDMDDAELIESWKQQLATDSN